METSIKSKGRRKQTNLPLAALLLIAVLSMSSVAFCQTETKEVPNGSEGLYLSKREKDSLIQKLPANEFEGSFSSFRIGLGYIHDFVTYNQSDVFKQQMDSAGLALDPDSKPRDFRILGSGVLKTKRTIAWKFAYMYDGDKNTWLVRESGITVGVPELAGHIFVGRTKEGFSLVKVMNGHSPWTAERQMALDVIPILADGIKWFGYLPKSRVFWNLGYFNDVISKGQGFSTFASQIDARVGFLPIYNKDNDKVLHVAANIRLGKPVDGKIELKSRPEANPAPQIINTGKFSADNSTHIGGEFYYSTGRFLVGSEVMVHKFFDDDADNHSFFGGDVVLTYFLTNTRRPYNTTGSIFRFVNVRKSVFKGGWGEWEAVLRYSTLDLNDGSIKGGKFSRITPMVNWYMSRVVRMEFVYGYGVLDRYNLSGAVQLFQARIQFTMM